MKTMTNSWIGWRSGQQTLRYLGERSDCFDHGHSWIGDYGGGLPFLHLH